MTKPNILLIVLDAVRANDLSIYGYNKNTTPYLKKILSKCVIYNNAISSSYWTMPSIASLFTGTYASTHSLIYDGDVLNPKYVTLAEFLKKNGYITIGLSPHPYVSRYTKLNRGFDIFEDFFRTKSILDNLNKRSYNILKKMEHLKIYKKIHWYITGFWDKYATKTNKQLFSILKSLKSNKPFFIYVHYNEAHTPYLIPKFYRDFFLSIKLTKKTCYVNQDYVKYYNNEIKMDDNDFEILRGIYNGAIKYLDKKIYEILIFLKNNDLFENTLIIITSDHGDQIGEHNLFFHVFSLYDFLIKVPLVIKYPKKLNKTGYYNNVVQNVDLFPTIIDLLNIHDKNLIKQFQGNSILSDDIINRNRIYGISELIKPFGPILKKYKSNLKKYDKKLISVRTQKYKYIYSSNGTHEFYNLENDPDEINNLIKIKKQNQDQIILNKKNIHILKTLELIRESFSRGRMV